MASHAPLARRLRGLVRAAWLALAALVVVLNAVGAAPTFADAMHPCAETPACADMLHITRQEMQAFAAAGISPQMYAAYWVAVGLSGTVVCTIVAALELAYPTFTAIIGLAARQLAQELGAIRVSPEWHTLARLRPAEWERSEA